jgi:glycosyltransferase involved in cell wall biosynthesis
VKDINRKKVLFLTAWYPPQLGIFVQNHARSVAGYVDVTVLHVFSFREVQNERIILDEFVDEKNGFRIIKVKYKESAFKLNLIRKVINGANYMYANYKGFLYLNNHNLKIDLIHVHVLTRAGLIALIYRWIFKKPYLITEHWTRYLPENPTFNGFLRKRLTKIVVKNARAVTTVCESLAQAMQTHKLYNSNYLVIPNSVDTERFKPATDKPGETITFLHVSGMSEKAKNISGILRVIAKLWLIRQDFQILLVGGKGDNEKYAVSQAKELKIFNSPVHFLGPLFDQELVKAYQKSDALILFSNYENLNVVLLEAWSSGIPVITTLVGGIAEHFSNNLGLAVHTGDEDDLLSKLISFMDNKSIFNKSEIRKYAVENFSNKIVGQKFCNLYDEIE